MPYIKQGEKRDVHLFGPKTPGQLNYAITMLLIAYMKRNELNYSVINDCLGALEGAKQEFYLRVAQPYELNKRDLNGDVYG